MVRFVRKDSLPDEEYYYQRTSDASYHLQLFEDDSSGLYRRIEVIDIDDTETIIQAKDFE